MRIPPCRSAARSRANASDGTLPQQSWPICAAIVCQISLCVCGRRPTGQLEPLVAPRFCPGACARPSLPGAIGLAVVVQVVWPPCPRSVRDEPAVFPCDYYEQTGVVTQFCFYRGQPDFELYKYAKLFGRIFLLQVAVKNETQSGMGGVFCLFLQMKRTGFAADLSMYPLTSSSFRRN